MGSLNQTLVLWLRTLGVVALPVAAAVALALPIAYHALEAVGGGDMPTGEVGYVEWFRYLAGWLSKGLIIALMTGGVAFLAYWVARQCAAAANTAAVAGVAAMVVLTQIARWCDATGATTVGVAVAALIVAGGLVNRVRTRQGIGNAIEGWWSGSVSNKPMLETVSFAQISLALYFGTIAIIAMTASIPAEFRWGILTLAGVGITAASVISGKQPLRDFLAISGAGISILGAYVEMDRAATASGSEIGAAAVMLGAGVIIWFPLTGLALRSGQVARILIAPMLVTGLATCATLLSTGILAILVSVRCNAGEKSHPGIDRIGGRGLCGSRRRGVLNYDHVGSAQCKESEDPAALRAAN